MSPSFLKKATDGSRLAYIHTPPKSGNKLPAILFCGGFKSDMTGSKATFLEQQCAARGQEYLRFDYSGHGQSEGLFEDGTISSWKEDAVYICSQVLGEKPVVVVGSSMGGWIALKLLLEYPQRIKGMLGIAAAPDFVEEIDNALTPRQKEDMKQNGRIAVPNDYSTEPYIFTQALIENGRRESVLNKTYAIQARITLIHGKKDAEVPWQKTVHIEKCFPVSDVRLIYVEDGDHRLSRLEDLRLIDDALMHLSIGRLRPEPNV